MTIWKAWARDPHEGYMAVWAASERDCRKLAKNSFAGNKIEACFQVEIPTNKKGLIDWLNENLNRENG